MDRVKAAATALGILALSASMAAAQGKRLPVTTGAEEALMRFSPSGMENESAAVPDIGSISGKPIRSPAFIAAAKLSPVPPEVRHGLGWRFLNPISSRPREAAALYEKVISHFSDQVLRPLRPYSASDARQLAAENKKSRIRLPIKEDGLGVDYEAALGYRVYLNGKADGWPIRPAARWMQPGAALRVMRLAASMWKYQLDSGITTPEFLILGDMGPAPGVDRVGQHKSHGSGRDFDVYHYDCNGDCPKGYKENLFDPVRNLQLVLNALQQGVTRVITIERHKKILLEQARLEGIVLPDDIFICDPAHWDHFHMRV